MNLYFVIIVCNYKYNCKEMLQSHGKGNIIIIVIISYWDHIQLKEKRTYITEWNYYNYEMKDY